MLLILKKIQHYLTLVPSAPALLHWLVVSGATLGLDCAVADLLVQDRPKQCNMTGIKKAGLHTLA
jgi:hypothetical protein